MRESYHYSSCARVISDRDSKSQDFMHNASSANKEAEQNCCSFSACFQSRAKCASMPTVQTQSTRPVWHFKE
eukprot:7681994-Karenia_brevis.AAC.1